MIKKLALALLLFAFGTAFAGDFSLCREDFANGIPPVIVHQEALQPRALCYSAFAVLHSGTSHTPVYVAERLNSRLLIEARNKQRTNKFYADARLPRAERAELADYHGTGFDRGHMAPAGDMASNEAMAQSFSLANMVPQYPLNNRRAWAGIEKATRRYVMRAAGDVFVITGPVFDGTPQTIGADHVWVPQHLFKLVYDPSTHRAWAHWLDNTNDARAGRPISYEELVRRTGIEFLSI
jgi:endonuclease G